MHRLSVLCVNVKAYIKAVQKDITILVVNLDWVVRVVDIGSILVWVLRPYGAYCTDITIRSHLADLRFNLI